MLSASFLSPNLKSLPGFKPLVLSLGEVTLSKTSLHKETALMSHSSLYAVPTEYRGMGQTSEMVGPH